MGLGDSLQGKAELKAIFRQLDDILNAAEGEDIVNILSEISNYLQSFNTGAGVVSSNTIRTIEASDSTLISGSDPLNKYVAANSETGGATEYYGAISKTGAWYISKYVVASGIITYVNGTSGYAAAWVGRAGLVYASFETLTW